MALTAAIPVTVAGKHLLKLCRRGPIARAHLSSCRASAHTTLPCLQPLPSRRALQQPGLRYSSVTRRPVLSFRQRMAAQNAAPLVWIDCEVKTTPPVVQWLVLPRSWQFRD